MAITIERAQGRQALQQFVRLPWRVYRGDRNWVPPLISERLDRLDPSRNPFFAAGQVETFLARDGRRPVGTIAAFVDHQSNQHLGERIGGFGFFECLPDYSVAQGLLTAACDTVQRWGMDGIRGPTNFGQNDEPGVLIGGADCPPAMLEAHTPPYYREFLERFGMFKDRDAYAWRVPLQSVALGPGSLPEQIERVLAAARERSGIQLRKIRLDDWEREVDLACDLFNATLKHLPEYVPTTREAFGHQADQMRFLLDPDLALFAEVGGTAVGFLVALPDFNYLLRRLNGHLYPFGWLKVLQHRRRIDTVSFKLFGVLEPYRRRGIDVLLYIEAVRSAAAKGYRWLDGSLTSETNPTVNRLAERLGAERYKHYRLYRMMF
jgi:GNAT superfamily N-acetyltransferase